MGRSLSDLKLMEALIIVLITDASILEVTGDPHRHPSLHFSRSDALTTFPASIYSLADFLSRTAIVETVLAYVM
ncbi:hypothetical protein DEU56DRAFT_569396 [Suillus clintonianus]|uniref:uncharacterized protein n=1 Tax=Suillus clintonianus TaxID=1904413 RepID=UPI001B86E164|nr:uncharacterized protein DEU56DRAFT_569396 [Suillus clintonianus]KAG2125495.1 hypothetical protein DEU56DRAFT_569396 [Suillus clintonianus]